jgi:dUTP pyrophosphatase
MSLRVRRLDGRARLPTRAYSGDAGLDLYALESVRLDPGERGSVRTGIAVEIPAGQAGLVLPRSGLAARHGVTALNAPGLVDPGYRGEIKVVLHNAGTEPYIARPGDRIAQLLLVPFWAPVLRSVEALPPTARGADGFGSTGR